MTVEAIQSSTATAGAQAAGGAELDPQQFLNLLVTQMRHQDPFSPMDNQAFMSQLTQFASLEQLQAISEQIGTNVVYTQSLNNTLMLDLIGRQATVPGERVTLTEGVATGNQIQATSGGTATVKVRDAAGNVVRTYPCEVHAGWTDISWDGKTDAGDLAEDGSYTLEVSVVDRAGQPIGFTSYLTAPVDSIRFENNIAIVRVAGEDYYVAEISQISR